jgi:hypothetical protein
VSKEFDAYKPAVLAQKAAVHQVNERFFEAIITGNIDSMKNIWMDSPDVQVVRSDVVSGYENVINMFAHELTPDRLRHYDLNPLQLRDTKLHFYVSAVLYPLSFLTTLCNREIWL